MNQELPVINGELLRLRRETRGWALSDLATRACMSVKQIRQLEEGGSSAFYSETVKWTSAKKVGGLLGMQPEEVFVQVAAEVLASTPVDVAVPPAVEPVPEALTETQLTAATEFVAAPDAVVPEASAATAAITHEPVQTSKTPWWSLAALFIAALAVAAWMRPEPEVVTEPAPVLQTLPAEASDATPASAPAVDASASVAASVQKTASTPAAAASAVQVPVAAPALAPASVSVPRASAPAASVASAATAAKPANAVQTPAAAPSAASVASKPL
jgi:transcriptional regulator with XRE-family HTH domain